MAGRHFIRQLDRRIQKALDRIFPENLTARYIFGLGAIAGLALTGQLMIQLTLSTQLDHQKDIRILDRETPELENLRKVALTIQLSSSTIEMRRQIENIGSILHRLTDLRKQLQPTPELKAVDTELAQITEATSKLSMELSATTDRRYLSKSAPLVHEIVESVTRCQDAVNELSRSLEQGLEKEIARFKKTEFLLFLATLIVLLLEAFYVFRPAVERLYDALRIRSEFLGRMSHELRNPMNSIIGMADLLSSTSITEQQKNYLSVLRRSGAGLLEMMNRVLDFSSMDAGSTKLEKTQFDLFELLERCLDLLVVAAELNHTELLFDFDHDVPIEVAGDPVRLFQILSNLVGNAVKFTKNGEVTLKVRKIEKPGEERIQFTVADTGIGIDPENLEKIFSPFIQADSSIRRRFGGSGLGLSIAKELVMKMGGKLTVSSEKNRGSTFGFDLPLEPRSREDLTRFIDELKIPTFKAVILEKNDRAAALIRELLERAGAEVERVHSPQDIERAAKGKNAVFLVNIESASSPEISRVLNPAQTLLLVKTTALPADIERWTHLGNGLVFKPVKPKQLLTMIQKVFKNSEEKFRPADALGASATKALSILIADDSKDNHALIHGYLHSLPYRLTFADTGKEAVDKYLAGSFDLVLMDIEMPELDGYSATRMIRDFEKGTTKHVPILGISAHDVSVAKAQEKGFSSWLVKPVSAPMLLKTIGELTHQAPARLPGESAIQKKMESLAPKYLESRRADLVVLKEALTKQDFTTIGRLGHRMKGNALTFGFPKLGEIGAELEESAENSHLSNAAAALAKMEEFLQEASKNS